MKPHASARRFPLLALLLLACSAGTGPATTQAVAQQEPKANPNVITIDRESPMLSQIKVDEIREEELPTDEVVSPAKLEIDPNRLSHVLLPAPGRIIKVHVRLGDRVKKGDTLITLDSPDADSAIADYKQAVADVSAANAALTKAKHDRDRVTSLFEHDAVAKKEVDASAAAFAAARSEMVRVQAEQQQARRKLSLLGLQDTKASTQTIAVRAPIEGKVLELRVVEGEFHTDTSEPLMAIGDLASLIVAADVAENAIRFVQEGEPVQIDLVAFPGEIFAATVVRIADTVDPKTRTIEVLAALANPDGRFRPEMFGRVRHGEALARTPALPSSAVMQRDGHDIILVEHGTGSYEMRRVKVDSRVGGKVAVVEGARVGERVVVDGSLLLLPPE